MSEGAREEAMAVDDDLRRPLPDYDSMTLDELAAAQGVREPMTVERMGQFDIFGSDEEMEAFIAFTYAARRRDWA
jgi:hypothetical protein